MLIKRYSSEKLSRKAFSYRLKLSGKKYCRNYKIAKFLYKLNYLWLFLPLVAVMLHSEDWDISLKGFVVILLMLLVVLVTVFVIILPYSALVSKIFDYETPGQLNYKCIAEFTAPIREFYGIGSEYVTTKCYSCTKVNFDNKDVIVFRHGDQLRITVDLFHSIKDLGCYIIPIKDLSFSNIKKDGLVCTVITGKNFEMTVGYRAGTFLKRTII